MMMVAGVCLFVLTWKGIADEKGTRQTCSKSDWDGRELGGRAFDLCRQPLSKNPIK